MERQAEEVAKIQRIEARKVQREQKEDQNRKRRPDATIRHSCLPSRGPVPETLEGRLWRSRPLFVRHPNMSALI